jgi:hypothetical protein
VCTVPAACHVPPMLEGVPCTYIPLPSCAQVLLQRVRAAWLTSHHHHQQQQLVTAATQTPPLTSDQGTQVGALELDADEGVAVTRDLSGWAPHTPVPANLPTSCPPACGCILSCCHAPPHSLRRRLGILRCLRLPQVRALLGWS